MKINMKLYKLKFSLLLSMLVLLLSYNSCEIDPVPDPNNPDVTSLVNDASVGDMQAVVYGIMSGMRNRIGTYLDGVGVIGREYYRFSGSDPRFTSDLLGKEEATLDNNTFYTTGPFSQRYRTIKNCNILLSAVENTSAAITAEEVAGTKGFAKTIIAHELLMVLNQQYENSIRVDVNDPDNLGPFLSDHASALDEIISMLDEAHTDLNGGSILFDLGAGFSGFNDAEGFAEFNRALAARANLYRGNNADALTALSNSFFVLTPNLYNGPQYIFSTDGGDALNDMWFPANAAGELRVAHPSFITDADAADGRLSKTTMRTDTAFQDDLSSVFDVSIYNSNTSPISIIRNEELILIYAEANIGIDNSEAVAAIDFIRGIHTPGNPYAGGMTDAELLDEVLHQRRYSLFGEGHRWIDLRRNGKLSELPIDRVGDDIWEQFPRPATE